MVARILIVEPQNVVAASLQQLLSQLGYEVAGTADGAEEAFCKIAELRPDLVLMDVALENEADGIDAAHRIRSRVDLPIVFVAETPDDRTPDFRDVGSPAEYVARTCSKRELHTAVEYAFHRHHYEGRIRKMADSVLDVLNYVDQPMFMLDDRGNILFINRPAREALEKQGSAALPRVRGTYLPKGMDALSRREMEVLNWFLRGFGTTSIGHRLHVSPQTVRNHLKSVCRKLDVRSQVELRELFAEEG
jgi:DNA-binding NarL/FixJ family response regulator